MWSTEDLDIGSSGASSKASVDFASVQFKFGDGSAPLDPIPPEHLLSFTYENTVSSDADKFTVELFDSTWSTIEELIIEKQNVLQFRFGWTYGKKSDWRKAVITKHTPTFEVSGLRLNIEGYDETLSANEEAIPRDWKDKKYIHEIVKAIADKNGWNYDDQSIVPTKLVSDEEGQSKIFLQAQMPDMTFIGKVLLKYAETPEGIGGFSCWLDALENKLHFRPPSLEAPVIKTYLVYRDRMGEVISFSPDLGDGSLQRSIGALNMRMTGVDPYTKELYDVVVDNKKTTDNKILNGPYIPDQTIATVGGAGRFMHVPVHNSTVAESVLKQRWFDRFNMFFTADLEIIGDPSIVPGSNIGVLVLDSQNQPHYCSGKYYIDSVSHSINNGSFTSTLKLKKNGMQVGTLNASREGYGQVRAGWEIIAPLLGEYIKPTDLNEAQISVILASILP